MTKHFAPFGLLLSASAALAAGPPPVIGINSAILGDVRVSTAAAPQPRAAVLRGRVALADRVQTAARSQLQVLLLDKSVFTVGANARLTIDRYVYDPNAGGRSFSASVAQGAFRFMSGRARSTGSTVSTPVAVIGIRGTIFEGVVGPDAVAIARAERGIPRNIPSDPATASLIVLRGPGDGNGAGLIPGAIGITAGGRTVSLEQPLQAAYVPRAGAAPIGPFQISLAGLARLQGLIFPSLLTRPMPIRSASSLPYPMPDRPSRPLRGILIGDPGFGQGPGPGESGRYVPGIPNPPPQQPGGQAAPAGGQQPQQQPQAPPPAQDPAGPVPPPQQQQPPPPAQDPAGPVPPPQQQQPPPPPPPGKP